MFPSVWLLGVRMRRSRGPLVNGEQREPWTVKKGNEGPQWDANSVLKEFINYGLLHPPPLVCGPRWRTPAPGRRRSKRWWRARWVAAVSGSSCGRSSARRTWCSGLPVRSWRKRPTRLWLRRKSVRYTRTSSPSSLQKRWGFDEEENRLKPVEHNAQSCLVAIFWYFGRLEVKLDFSRCLVFLSLRSV